MERRDVEIMASVGSYESPLAGAVLQTVSCPGGATVFTFS